MSITVLEGEIHAVDRGSGGWKVESVLTIDFWSSDVVTMAAGSVAAWPIHR